MKDLLKILFSTEDSGIPNIEFILPNIIFFGIWTLTGKLWALAGSIVGFIAFSITDALVERVVKEMRSEIGEESIDKKLRRTGEIIVEKKESGRLEKLFFLLILFSGGVSMASIGAGILSGFWLLINFPVAEIQLILLVWAIFLFKLVHKFTGAFFTPGFRGMVLKMQHELPGKDFWKNNQD